jgi:hypothetical protein
VRVKVKKRDIEKATRGIDKKERGRAGGGGIK